LESRAHLLNTFQIAYGNPNALEKDLSRYQALTTKGVTEAGKKLLGAGHVIVTVIPPPAPSGKGGAVR
jgi:hypothetical protein